MNFHTADSAEKFLIRAGWEIESGTIRRNKTEPRSAGQYKPTESESETIDYLCNEFDYTYVL